MIKKTTLRITGMHCASCAANSESALKGLPGVSQAVVNIATEKATIEYDPEVLNEAALKKAVENAGYGVALAEASLGLIGMHCATCALTIEKALQDADGVIKANVNLASETATILYNPEVTTVPVLRKVVEKAGYQAVSRDTGGVDREKEARAREARNLKLLMVFSFILAVPTFILSLASPVSMMTTNWIMLGLATPVQFFVGSQFYIGTFKA